MPEEVLFKSERKQSRDEIADYLQTVAEKLKGGDAITLHAGEESVTLDVPTQSTFEVKAEREIEGDETELSVEFELEWDEGTDGENGTLEIG